MLERTHIHIYTSHYDISCKQLHLVMYRGRERKCTCSQSTRLKRVATRNERCIKFGEQLTAVARRFPELGTIYNCIVCKYRVESWKEMCRKYRGSGKCRVIED